jgi:hypothetical protein
MPSPTLVRHAPSTVRSRVHVTSSSQLFQPELPQLTPHQSLWIQVLRRLHEDLARDGQAQLSAQDHARLEFVAMAIGLPGDTVPRLLRAGRQEHTLRQKGETHVSASASASAFPRLPASRLPALR